MAALTRRGIAAAALSSGTAPPQRDALLADLCSGSPAIKLLFCTPELLATDRSAPPPAAPYDTPSSAPPVRHSVQALHTTQWFVHACHEVRLLVAVGVEPLQARLRRGGGV